VPPAIEIKRVSKKFDLGKESFDSLKERLVHFGRTKSEEFWALREVELDIAQGETIGLLGHNGSGKSTLLKIIAGILQPTYGEVVTRGRMSALLELGAGFHPDLTGRENVEMNGLLLGLSRRDIAKRFDDIVEFAGEQVSSAIDRQVKFYSSGMFVRLGFSVAVSIEPEILLVDEVLAVGDEAFAQKCLAKIKQFQREGRTIVFVTHGVDIVREICDRAAVLDHGLQIADGKPADAIRTFREHLFATGRAGEAQGIYLEEDEVEEEVPEGEAPRPRKPRRKVLRITEVTCSHAHQDERQHVYPGEPVQVEVRYSAEVPFDDPIIGIGLFSPNGVRIWGGNSQTLDVALGTLAPGEGAARFRIDSLPLLDGHYALQVGINDRDGQVIDWIDSMDGFEVGQHDKSVGIVALHVGLEHLPDPASTSPQGVATPEETKSTGPTADPSSPPEATPGPAATAEPEPVGASAAGQGHVAVGDAEAREAVVDGGVAKGEGAAVGSARLDRRAQ